MAQPLFLLSEGDKWPKVPAEVTEQEGDLLPTALGQPAGTRRTRREAPASHMEAEGQAKHTLTLGCCCFSTPWLLSVWLDLSGTIRHTCCGHCSQTRGLRVMPRIKASGADFPRCQRLKDPAAGPVGAKDMQEWSKMSKAGDKGNRAKP